MLNFDLFSLMEPYRSLGEESSHVDGKLSGCLVILGVATIMMLRVWVIIQGPKICSVNRAITACCIVRCFGLSVLCTHCEDTLRSQSLLLSLVFRV